MDPFILEAAEKEKAKIPFRVLLITSDVSVFSTGSSAQDQILKYSEAMEELYVIVANSVHIKDPIRKLAPNTWIYATNSIFPFLYPWSIVQTAISQITMKLRLRARLIVVDGSFLPSLGGWILSLLYKRKIFINLLAEDLRRDLGLYSFIWSKAAGIRVVSEEAKEILSARAPHLRDRITILPNFFDAQRWSNGLINPKFDLHTIYPHYNIIAIVKNKRLTSYEADFLIDALRRLSGRYIRLGLIFLGPSYEHAPLLARARIAGVTEHLTCLSSDEGLLSYYKSANMLWGIGESEAAETLKQAAASGIPIVTRKFGIATQFVENGTTGFICEEDKVELFVRKVIDIVETPGLRESMRIKAQEKALTLYDMKSEDYIFTLRQAWFQSLQRKS